MTRPLALALVAGGTTSSLAETHKDYPRVEDTSHAEPDGTRVIQLSTEVPAGSDAVWRAFTTAEGWKSFAVAFAQVDFRVGGILETSYNAQAKAGDPDNIKNQVVAYVPGRMLAIRCVQAPRSFEHKEEFFATATIIELQPTHPGSTRVTTTSVGFRPGAAYDDLFAKFRWGNAYTLEKLRQRFEPKPPAKPEAAKPAAGEAK